MACRVCCFCCSGDTCQGGIAAAGSGSESRAGKERHGLCQRQAILHHEPLQLAEFLRRGLVPLELQHHPLQQLDHRIQGAVLVIGRTLARRQPRLGLGGHVLLQHLHQARFADPRFAAEQHDLPDPVLDLRPALQQQPHFLLPAHQRGQASAAGHVQATARRTLIQHPIDLQRLARGL